MYHCHHFDGVGRGRNSLRPSQLQLPLAGSGSALSPRGASLTTHRGMLPRSHATLARPGGREARARLAVAAILALVCPQRTAGQFSLQLLDDEARPRGHAVSVQDTVSKCARCSIANRNWQRLAVDVNTTAHRATANTPCLAWLCTGVAIARRSVPGRQPGRVLLPPGQRCARPGHRPPAGCRSTCTRASDRAHRPNQTRPRGSSTWKAGAGAARRPSPVLRTAAHASREHDCGQRLG